jgi:protein-tyrosine phosphatase
MLWIIMIKLLFVCMGNICRSPTAEAVFRHLVNQNNLADKIETDSAGTHAYHVGELSDNRARQVAQKRNIKLESYARKIINTDFIKYDYILAMDKDNYTNLYDRCPIKYRNKISLFLSFAPKLKENEVPDPYYGGTHGFEYVLDLTEVAARGLLDKITQN